MPRDFQIGLGRGEQEGYLQLPDPNLQEASLARSRARAGRAAVRSGGTGPGRAGGRPDLLLPERCRRSGAPASPASAPSGAVPGREPLRNPQSFPQSEPALAPGGRPIRNPWGLLVRAIRVTSGRPGGSRQPCCGGDRGAEVTSCGGRDIWVEQTSQCKEPTRAFRFVFK